MLWLTIVQHISKGQRYTVASRIENKFLDLLEFAYIAYFTEKERKAEQVHKCILVLDVIKFLIHIIWEGKFISHKQYGEIAEKLNEIGKMLGGWKKSLENPEKKNRTL